MRENKVTIQRAVKAVQRDKKDSGLPFFISYALNPMRIKISQ